MDTQQQQALNVLRGLLPTLPVIDYSIPGGQIEIPLNVQSPQGYNELARVTRVGPNAWEVSISGMAEMNCTKYGMCY